MKTIMTLLAAVMLLAACQQSNDKDDNSKAEATQASQSDTSGVTVSTDPLEEADRAIAEQAEAARHKHEEEEAHQHDLMTTDSPFTEIKPEYACEKPLVIEFFAYQCPHCSSLEPALQAWLAKNDGKVDFLPVPTHLGHEQFGSLLLVHHAAKKLAVLDKAMPALFNRVHVEQKLFTSPEEAADFLAAFGADKVEALNALNDQQAVGEAIEADFQMMAKYKIASVPRILVNHQYMTDISAAGGIDKVFPLVDELLEKPHSCK